MEQHGGNVYKIARDMRIPVARLLDFSSNINPLGVPNSFKKVVEFSFEDVVRYPDPDCVALREAAARYHGINCDNIIIGNGATELIYLLCRSMNHKKALIVSPTFSEYERALALANADIDFYPLKEEDDFILYSEKMIGTLSKEYSLLVICNPNNPTGTLIHLNDIKRILIEASNYNVRVLVDESFMPFVSDEERYSSIPLCSELKNLFVIRSLTKIFAIPGLRLGYAVSSDRELHGRLNMHKEPWTVNVIAERAGRIFLDNNRHIQKTKAFISSEKDYLYKGLQEIPWLSPVRPAVNFILVKILSGISSLELQKQLLRNNILIRDASNFKFLNHNYFRVAVKNRRSNNKLLDALRNVKQ